MKQPTVYIVTGADELESPSAVAYDDSGEIVETVTWKDGKPDWSEAGFCDDRGAGGSDGFDALREALQAAERNAALCGFSPIRWVPVEA